MCRKNAALAGVLIALGAGLLLSLVLDSPPAPGRRPGGGGDPALVRMEAYPCPCARIDRVNDTRSEDNGAFHANNPA